MVGDSAVLPNLAGNVGVGNFLTGQSLVKSS